MSLRSLGPTGHRFADPSFGKPITKRSKKPMSTIPLTLIEGAMALPSLRPLDALPAPFGRDWALRPPGHSLRAELKALYAAMLRTFCLSEETMLSLGKWDAWERWRAEAADGRDEPAPADEGAAERAQSELARTPADRVGAAMSSNTLKGAASTHRRMIAGGACALGGAAVLTWLAFGHLTHRHLENRSLRSDVVAANAGSRAAGSLDGLARAPRADSMDAVDGQPASPDYGASGSVSVSVPTGATDSPAHQVMSSQSPSLRRNGLADVGSNPSQVLASRHGLRGRSSATTITASPARHPQKTTRASAAGPYSALASSRAADSDYANITLSAGTHLPGMTTASRAARVTSPVERFKPSNSVGTEWVDGLTQRRITETPEQFLK